MKKNIQENNFVYQRTQVRHEGREAVFRDVTPRFPDCVRSDKITFLSVWPG